MTKKVTQENLSDFIYKAYMLCFECGLGTMLTNGDIEYLIRKLPSELLDEHIAHEDDRLIKMLMQVPQFKNLDADLFTHALLYTLRSDGDFVHTDNVRLCGAHGSA